MAVRAMADDMETTCILFFRWIVPEIYKDLAQFSLKV